MNRRIFIGCLVFLLILLGSILAVGGHAILGSDSIQLEVREPLEISGYNSSLSVFPGETLRFTVSVVNHASVAYNVSLRFSLNDTNYQNAFVSFSNDVYVVEPGQRDLGAWFSVSGAAPAALLELTVDIARDMKTESAPTVSLTPSATLLGAGARWAAGNGTSALYVNWLDNYDVHHLSDGSSWGPYWGENFLASIKNTTVEALEQQGFTVTCAADVPKDVSGYDLVVFEASYAVEPSQTSMVRDYLAKGGSVVVIGGVPCYFSTYCKDMWPYVTGGQNLASLKDWFGSAYYVNSGGWAKLTVDNPFGTSLLIQNKFFFVDGYSAAGVAEMSNDTQVLATWGDGTVFAFTHEYGEGRVYYQALIDW